MLSFGMEYERAFSIAFCSARLPVGSAPPSRAATMIARDSFEKSFPRFASAAPFLCLIDDHLLCPDTSLLPYGVQKQLVHPRIVGQLRMERGDEDPALAKQDGSSVVLREHLQVWPGVGDARRADEDAAQRLLLAGQLEVRLEARDLASVRVPLDLEIGEPEVIPVEDDHARTAAEDRPGKRAHGLVEVVEPHQ